MGRSFLLLLLLVTLGSCRHYREPTGSWRGRGTRSARNNLEPQIQPVIRSLRITSDIKYRYATTLVSTTMDNPSGQQREAKFIVTLPDTAFISEFLLEVKDEVYKAYVKEKEAARTVYEDAVKTGKSGGHVANVRDSNQFTVSLNIEPFGKAIFNLTYEQLLPRNLGLYNNVININPHQIVEELSVIVNIEEPTAITYLEVPELQVSNEAIPTQSDKHAKIEIKSKNHKQVIWKLTTNQQKRISPHGVSGQFIVKYDVDREDSFQHMLFDEGYFVHFFAPENLPNMRKHAIFVLDFSSSMRGRKLIQLKEAMVQIFSDLSPDDYFSIVIFQSFVEAWAPKGKYATGGGMHRRRWKTWKQGVLDEKFVMKATESNKQLARSFMESYYHLGSTNIMGGLRTGLKLVDIGGKQWENESDPPQPVLVFLTDGEPNVEESNTDIIINKTKDLNKMECPIYSLAFGHDADFPFLRKLSLQNFGFARKIYEAADATQQLENFYKTIASPLISDVTFTYLPGKVDSSSNTHQNFPVLFRGSELVVAGKVNTEKIAQGKPIGELRGTTATGPFTSDVIPDHVSKPQTSSVGQLEKVWSFVTIRQLLDKVDSLDNGAVKTQTRKEALNLALKYGFVTPLTSMVVVKPTGVEPVDPTQMIPGTGDSCTDPSECPESGFEGDIRFGASAESDNLDNRSCYEVPVTQAPPLEQPYNPSSGDDLIVFPSDDSTETLDAGDRFGDPGPPPETTQSSNSVSQMEEDKSPRKISLQDVKWIKGALNTTDSFKCLKIEGNNYKIGINETNSAFGDCIVNGDPGECHHFEYCALDVFQDEASQFLPYECLVSESFLGVCCPKYLV